MRRRSTGAGIQLGRGRWRKPAVVALVAAILVSVGVGIRTALNRPEHLRIRVVAALERRDYGALCALADPEELSELNLTREGVAAILEQTTLGRPGVTWKLGERLHPMPPDRAAWVLHPGDPTGALPPFGVEFIYTRGVGWKLCLSWFLYAASNRYYPHWRTRVLYHEMARKYNIRGVRFARGGYYTIDELEQSAKGLRPNMLRDPPDRRLPR